MPYRIDVSVSAQQELLRLPVFLKPIVASAIDQHLVHEPLVQSRNRKPLRDEVKANFGFTPTAYVGIAGW